LRDFERVGESIPKMVAVTRDENLRFAFQSPKRFRMNNSRVIALKFRSKLIGLVGKFSRRGVGESRVFRQICALAFLEIDSF
jgi:hypothetical protein